MGIKVAARLDRNPAPRAEMADMKMALTTAAIREGKAREPDFADPAVRNDACVGWQF